MDNYNKITIFNILKIYWIVFCNKILSVQIINLNITAIKHSMPFCYKRLQTDDGHIKHSS